MAARFRRLSLRNWRNFKRVDVELGRRVFVVGPNASGKSNLLDAIRFLRDIARPGGGLVSAVTNRRGLKHIRSLHAGNDSGVSIEVEVDLDGDPNSWTYALTLSGSESKNRPLRVEQEIVRHGEEEVSRRNGGSDPRLSTQTNLEQTSQSVDFRQLAEALGSVLHVHVVPQVARAPERAEEFSLRDAPGSDFIDQLARLTPAKRRAALKRVEKLLRIAVPGFSELDVDRDELGKPHLVARYEHWRKRGGWQNEREFSDGTLRLIGLLWAIDTGDAPLLLEEPELSLHREVIRQLPRLFSQAAARNGRQIIVSTHAEEILGDRGIDPSEILVLDASSSATSVVRGSDHPKIVEAARARVPLGRVVSGLTKPKRVEQLSLPLEA